PGGRQLRHGQLRRLAIAFLAHLHVRFGSRSQGAQVGRSDARQADDVRNQHNENLALLFLYVLAGEKVPQQGDPRETWPAGQRFFSSALNYPAENIDFTLLHRNIVVNHALADNGLLDPADVHAPSHRRDFHLHLQADFVARVDARGDVHVHAHIDVLELRVHKRVHDPCTAYARCAYANARLETACGDRDAITDAQLGRLSVHHADLWILDDFCGAVGQQRGSGRTRQPNAIVRGRKVLQLVEGNGVRRGGRGAARRRGGSVGEGARGERGRVRGVRLVAGATNAVASGLQHRHLDDDFRLGLVNVADQLVGQQQLVGC